MTEFRCLKQVITMNPHKTRTHICDIVNKINKIWFLYKMFLFCETIEFKINTEIFQFTSVHIQYPQSMAIKILLLCNAIKKSGCDTVSCMRCKLPWEKRASGHMRMTQFSKRANMRMKLSISYQVDATGRGYKDFRNLRAGECFHW